MEDGRLWVRVSVQNTREAEQQQENCLCQNQILWPCNEDFLSTFRQYTWTLSKVLVFALTKVVRNFLLPSLLATSSFPRLPPLVILFIWRGAGIIDTAGTGEVSQVVWPLPPWRLTAFWHGCQRLAKADIDSHIRCTQTENTRAEFRNAKTRAKLWLYSTQTSHQIHAYTLRKWMWAHTC